MEEIKLKDHQEWAGTYKGISFQIAKWKGDFSTPEMKQYDKGYTWNYYIYVNPRPVVTIDFQWSNSGKRIDYYKMYPDVEMHGGITFISESSDSELNKSHKLGCDYAHSWDFEEFGHEKLKENKVEWILKDVQETIDKLPPDLFFSNK